MKEKFDHVNAPQWLINYKIGQLLSVHMYHKIFDIKLKYLVSKHIIRRLFSLTYYSCVIIIHCYYFI
jgi:hypothetical protein